MGRNVRMVPNADVYLFNLISILALVSPYTHHKKCLIDALQYLDPGHRVLNVRVDRHGYGYMKLFDP